MLSRSLSFVFAMLLAACAAAPSPLNTTSWRDPDFRGPPFRKIFVAGLGARAKAHNHEGNRREDLTHGHRDNPAG